MTARGCGEAALLPGLQRAASSGGREFLAAVDVPEREAELPHCHAKRTRQDKIDYPLVTLCAVRDGVSVRCRRVRLWERAAPGPGAGACRGAAAVCGALAGEAADSLSGSGRTSGLS